MAVSAATAALVGCARNERRLWLPVKSGVPSDLRLSLEPRGETSEALLIFKRADAAAVFQRGTKRKKEHEKCKKQNKTNMNK